MNAIGNIKFLSNGVDRKNICEDGLGDGRKFAKGVGIGLTISGPFWAGICYIFLDFI